MEVELTGVEKLVDEIEKVAKKAKQKEENERKEKGNIIIGIYQAIEKVRDNQVIEIKVDEEESTLRIAKNSLSFSRGGGKFSQVVGPRESDFAKHLQAIAENESHCVRIAWLKAVQIMEKGEKEKVKIIVI